MIEKVFVNRHLGIKFNSYIDKKCRVWFKAKEVAQILGYKDTDKAIRKHVSENHKKTFLFYCPAKTAGQQNNKNVPPPKRRVNKMTQFIQPKCSPVETMGQQIDTRGKYCLFIDEAGFYELVFRSRLPAAKMFREWVFSKVLPSIRKYGYYKFRDSKIKKRVTINGVKYYKHQVFDNYAASRNGDVINIKTEKILNGKKKNFNNYLLFTIHNKKLEKPFTYLQRCFVYEVFKGPIPKCLEIDHQNGVKSDNRIKNLQLLTPRQNSEKSNNKAIISTCVETGKERRFISIKTASIELSINSAYISDICRKKKYCKTATSKKDKHKYTFRYLD